METVLASALEEGNLRAATRLAESRWLLAVDRLRDVAAAFVFQKEYGHWRSTPIRGYGSPAPMCRSRSSAGRPFRPVLLALGFLSIT
jgi:hypothetical protein